MTICQQDFYHIQKLRKQVHDKESSSETIPRMKKSS